jgi:ferredoxin/flavodoxin---NADP+ reductase
VTIDNRPDLPQPLTSPPESPSQPSAPAARRRDYNAVVTKIRRVHEDLLILRVRGDGGPIRFLPGQYTVLGLGDWEPRVDGVQREPPHPKAGGKLIQRAYSISSPVLDAAGRLVPAERSEELEFYIALVRAAAAPPALTPRMFALSEGDRLFVGPRARGTYTLAPVRPEDAVVLVATGTGEAPHNAMIAELLHGGHRGPIVSVVSNRLLRDAAYLDVHRELERRHANYRYLHVTTREPENLDPEHPGFVGRRHVQELFASGQIERETALRLNPEATHVYLCGNPAMIGVPTLAEDGTRSYPRPKGMVEVLEQRGLVVDQPRRPGSIHFEKYW